MAAPIKTDPKLAIPTEKDFEKLLTAKLSYEAKQNTPERDSWNKAHFNETPWGISYNVSRSKYNKSVASYNAKGKGAVPVPKIDIALKYFIVAVAIDWQELIGQLKRTLINWGYQSKDIQDIAKNIWLPEAQNIANTCDKVTVTKLIEQLSESMLVEAVEKHDSLNSKLFTKEELLKENVRNKMLEIVDEFILDLSEQEIEIKVDDILFIGSNASYNYTKDSDIDLHILANSKATKYSKEVAEALYSAYRSIFNKQLDIKLFNIPIEVFVETEYSTRVSNGVYSVKHNRWVKKPAHEEIPDYDIEALNKLIVKWEDKCNNLIDDIKADKLKDEKKVIKLLEDIYDKLRKNGIAKGEYSIENLTFKELRNKGYLDKLKDYRNELTSKRLSLEERLARNAYIDKCSQLTTICGSAPIIQDNGMFFIYNVKASDIDHILQTIKKLPFVVEAAANENGRYDFSDTLKIALNRVPSKYYDIRGILDI